MTLRKRTYDALEFSARGRRGLSFVANIFLVSVIIINSIAIIFHTIPELRHNDFYEAVFQDIEVFSVIIFTIEYWLRIWSCVENPKYPDNFRGRLKYAFSFWGIVDFLGIFPFYFTLLTSDFGIIRILRVFRLFRLFRITRYSHALKLIRDVVTETKEELVLSFAFIMFTLLISSSAMYYIEHEYQPDKFKSIPASLWWGVITMTTTGYGDVYPITTVGKILGGIVSMLGVALFSLPTGIMAWGFVDHIQKQKTQHKVHCPHCGKVLAEADLNKHSTLS
jgi:voltage-gated potassium channel